VWGGQLAREIEGRSENVIFALPKVLRDVGAASE